MRMTILGSSRQTILQERTRSRSGKVSIRIPQAEQFIVISLPIADGM